MSASASLLYDSIGRGYAAQRRPDPRIAAHLNHALGPAGSVLNVGAGTGSYEPADRLVVAVEPSVLMLAQRLIGTSVVRARAEALPFLDRTFDAVMAVLTLHHWEDQTAGLAECARVGRERVVLLTWDAKVSQFWLVEEYFPEFLQIERGRFPAMQDYEQIFGTPVRTEIIAVPVPRDCVDGFLGAYWARPAAYLDPEVRSGISSFSRPGVQRGLQRLAEDLHSGVWHARYGYLLKRDTLDLGYRIVVAHLPNSGAV